MGLGSSARIALVVARATKEEAGYNIITNNQGDTLKTILSIRFQTYPFWIIKPDGTSIHLDVTENDLNVDHDGIADFETWIKDNRDKYGITHILDENWIEFDKEELYGTMMTVDEYLNDRGYWD